MGSLSIFNSLFQIGSLSFLCLATIVAGVVIWWIVRKRIRNFWMPIVRILDRPISRLPRVVIKIPPLIPFLAFVISALALLFWTSRPSLKIFSDFEPGLSQVHVFVDMSPSVSSHVTLNELGTKFVELLEQIGPKAKVTFGTSHSDDVYELTTTNGAADLITGIGFHRGGAKIGSGVRAQVSRIGDIDQLFIVSDRDQHSWSGFQWQYLLVDADVKHVDLDNSSVRGPKSNVFIQDARFLSGSGALTMDWDIEIALGVLASPVNGTINASVGGESLATANWEIASGKRNATVSVSWPSTKVPETLMNDAIEWTLEISGGDALLADNKFRTPVLGKRDRIVVIGEPSGELRLEDHLMPLETALKVSGYDVARFDRWSEKFREKNSDLLSSARFLVAKANVSASLDYWCPSGVGVSSQIWLVPESLSDSYMAMCECVAKFDVGVTKEMCEPQLNRSRWLGYLAAVGAKQVGGDIGSTEGSIAMRLADAAKKIDLLLFALPLKPERTIGLTWGNFPILIQQLARFSAGGSLSNGAGAIEGSGLWPRIGDVSSFKSDASQQVSGRTQILRETNVPMGESILAVNALTELPPAWSAVGSGGRDKGANKRDSDDPWPWIKFLVGTLFLAGFLEVIWSLRAERAKRLAKMVGELLLFCACVSTNVFGLLDHWNRAHSQVQLDLLGLNDTSSLQFMMLAREVTSRTSLEMSPKADVFGVFDDVASERPWIWTQSVGKLAGKNGKLLDGARLWMKRGGILIIDGLQSQEALDRLFEPLTVGTVRPSGWVPLPPDHEFMRSFYLLNSLPICKGQQWKIFSIDGRVAAIITPYSLLSQLKDQPDRWSCEGNVSYEQNVRIFVNLMMMAMTTDYKRDQIHLPEILKRLRIPQ